MPDTSDGFLHRSISPGSSVRQRYTLTLRDINDRLEHQRHNRDEYKVVEEELGRAPSWRRGPAICAGASVLARLCRCSKTSVESVQRVQASKPAKKTHCLVGIAKVARVELVRGSSSNYTDVGDARMKLNQSLIRSDFRGSTEEHSTTPQRVEARRVSPTSHRHQLISLPVMLVSCNYS